MPLPPPELFDREKASTLTERFLSALARFIVFAVPAFAFALSIHQLKGGWDDGAITAAFSRTLAETGRFALTPLSEKVEGFSSVAWVFLLAVPYYLFHSTVAILVWMKLLAALSFLFALIIFRRLAGRLLENPVQTDLTTILTAFVVCPLLETIDGMEMNFYMLLVLWLVDVLTDEQPQRHRALWIWGLTFALIANRFESPYIVAALLAGLLLSRDGSAFRQLATAAAAAFGMMEFWRYHEFGVWMPNTVYAKMNPPYSPPHLLAPMLWTRIFAAEEFAAVLCGPLLAVLLVAAGALMYRYLPLPRACREDRGAIRFLLLSTFLVIVFFVFPHFAAGSPSHKEALISLGFELLAIALICKACLGQPAKHLEQLTAALAAAGVAFGVIFGKNWGYSGRMILPCIPFVVLAIAYFIIRHIPSEYWRQTALAGCMLSQMLTWTFVATAAWNQGSGVPVVSSIERTGLAADAIRRLSNLESLSVLLPDVGASSLCCERLQILDSALLTNTFLAHNGYKAIDGYLHERRPQVIETHGKFGDITQIYRNELINGYGLAVVNHSRLLLRNDVYWRTYARLQATTGVSMGYGEQCLGDLPGVADYKDTEDIEFVKARKTCLYISRDDLLRNGIPLN